MTAAPLTEQGAIRASFPAKLKPLFEFGKYRYKVLYGGRGGAKSWSIARALLLIASERKIDILCAREYQINIGNSVHELLKQQIEALGLTSSYSVTDTRITCLATGSRFFFRGLHNNAAEIKSFEGVSLCWVEEAQAVSAASWDVLDPTIRKPGSEIWMSFNPGSPDDETWRRFVVSPPPNAWVQKISWKDNKWFNPTMNKIRLHALHTDPERYKHIWDGEPEIISDAQVFKGRYLVQEFETPKDARFFQGADWGFAADPTVLIRCFIRGNVLYIDREAYGVGVELDETPQLFDSIDTARKWPIYADSARPETISFMKRRGFHIMPAKKWPGSIEDGIAVLKSFDKIIVHPRCVHTADEFYRYSYKVDKNNGEVLPVIVDAYNHCVAEGTIITTECGSVPIEKVTTSDKVLTREGFKRVLWSGKTGENREVLEISAGGSRLICTPEHLIYTINRGFVKAATVTGEDVLLCLEKQLYTTDLLGTDIQTRDAEATACITSAQLKKTANITRKRYTGTFTKKRMAKSRRASTFITRTGTLTTTRLKIWNVFPPLNMCINTRSRLNGTKSKKNFLNKFDRLQRLGIEAQKAAQNTKKSAGLRIRISRQNRSNARIAARRFFRENSAIKTGSVQTPVNLHGGDNSISTMKKGLAQFAASPFLSINTATRKLVPVRVQTVSARKKPATVYDLAITGQNEFFANGILIHNCLDAARYSLTGYITRGSGMKINPINLRGR